MSPVLVGTSLPILMRRIDMVDMVAYAGATWDWHRLHYDAGYVRERGLASPVVDGQVFGAFLAEQVQDWLGPRALVRRMRFRFKQMVFAGEIIECHGEVTAIQDTLEGLFVRVAQRVTVGERQVIDDAESDVFVPTP